MANHPSQVCRICEGKGWFHRSAKVIDPCELCHGYGRITIRLARILGWMPIRHRKRVARPMQLSLGGPR